MSVVDNLNEDIRRLDEELAIVEAENCTLKKLLNLSHEAVCSLRCPSVWKTEDGQTHTPLCEQITQALKESEK